MIAVRADYAVVDSRAEPSAAIIDTQSVKTSTNPPLETQGTDAAKLIVGRKRSITDALGLLLAVVVSAASVHENNAGIRVLEQAKAIHPTITMTWVDQGFKNRFVEHAAALGVNAEGGTRNPKARGFHVLKRRLIRDYEALTSSSEAMIQLAMIENMSKRITGETVPMWRRIY